MATTSSAVTWTTDYIAGTPRLAVDQQGTGPLLIFMHGIGGNRTNWHDQFAAFAKHFTVVSWDARAYGNSDDYDGPLNPLDFSHDLKRLLDSYGVPKAEGAHRRPLHGRHDCAGFLQPLPRARGHAGTV